MKILSLVKKRILTILFLGVVLSGCGVWTDFTTYFNLYYNTKVAFAKAEEEIQKQRLDIFEFHEVKVVGPASQNLDKVVEKCSKILQFNSESSYVDDALFMIGKAFYYQQSYSRAIRKFLELLAVEEKSLALEAELWLGKSRLQMREFEEGINILESVKQKALEQGDEDFYDQATIAQIAYWIYREEYETAINGCNSLIKTTENDELISETYYKLGELYVTMEDYENAMVAFSQVNEFSPSFDLEFLSQLEYAKVESQLGRFQESQDILNDLFNEDKFSEDQDLIQLEIGKNYYEMNDIEDAMDVFILVDSMYSNSDNVGISNFYLGKIWEYKFGNFDSAKIYYRAATNQKLPEEYRDSSKNKVEILDRYTFLRKEYNSTKDKRIYLVNPDKFVEDSITYHDYEVRLNDFLEAKLAELGTDNPLDKSQIGVNDNQVGDQDQAGRNIPGQRGTPSNPPGGTSADKPVDKTQALDNLKMQLKPSDYPPDLIEVKKPERTSLSIDSLNSIIAKIDIDLGNLFFTDLNVEDSSYHYYNEIITEFEGHRLYPQGLFAMGSLLLTMERKQEADSLFGIIYYEYPQSSVFVEAAKKLDLWNEEDFYDPSQEIYIRAENKYYNNQIDSAITIWRSIVNDYPSSKYAPKSLYAIGYILENDYNKYDSAAVFYSRLEELYGNSQYAMSIKDKLISYYGLTDSTASQTNDSTNISLQIPGNIVSSGKDSVVTIAQNEDRISEITTDEIAPERILKKTERVDFKKELIVYFNLDKYDLTPASLSTLDEFIQKITLDNTGKFILAGHTCNIGDEKYNIWLSRKRAESVEKFLIGKNISIDNIEIQWFGESIPRYDNHDKTGRSKNRRVEIRYGYQELTNPNMIETDSADLNSSNQIKSNSITPISDSLNNVKRIKQNISPVMPKVEIKTSMERENSDSIRGARKFIHRRDSSIVNDRNRILPDSLDQKPVRIREE